MRFATDENFDGNILRGLVARMSKLDVIRVQDTEMYQSSDEKLLEWLAQNQRILLTHDVNTIPRYMYERVNLGKIVVGVIAVHQNTPIGQAIDEIEILIGAGTVEDFENQVKYVPIR